MDLRSYTFLVRTLPAECLFSPVPHCNDLLSHLFSPVPHYNDLLSHLFSLVLHYNDLLSVSSALFQIIMIYLLFHFGFSAALPSSSLIFSSATSSLLIPETIFLISHILVLITTSSIRFCFPVFLFLPNFLNIWNTVIITSLISFSANYNICG